MAQVYASFNQKGGVGKTTTTVNLAAAFGEDGYRVLVIDGDPQANTTNTFGIADEDVEDKSLYDLIVQKKTPDPAPYIIKTNYNVDLIPSHITLADAEQDISSYINREQQLKKIVAKVEDQYDYIFIDAPPSLGILSINALTACKKLIIPIEPAYYSIKGLTHLKDTFEAVKESLVPDLEIAGVLMTRYEKTKMALDIEADLREFFDSRVFDTKIRKNQAIRTSQDKQMPIGYFDKKSNGYIDYKNLQKELMEA